MRDIRVDLYQHILNLRLKFDRTPIGVLVTRNISDVETLSDVFSEGLAAMIDAFLTVATAALGTLRPFLIQKMVDQSIEQGNLTGVNEMFALLPGATSGLTYTNTF